MTHVLDISTLYVEDDDFTRDSVLGILNKKVSKIYIAANGQQGLEVFKNESPDLVITDIKMPYMDGIVMCREIKALRPKAQIIITTAYSDLAYLLDAIDIGISQYVLKPVDMSKLFIAIDKCYETLSLEQEVARQNETKERFIKELQESASKIKTLGGLLPICAACKRVRDDKGYWEQIEAYISSRSEAEFTHCLCPECMKRLYPQFCK